MQMGFADHAAWWAMVIGAYAILWFLSLLMLLPVGLNHDDDPPGQFVPGAAPVAKAPPRLSLAAKAGWSTLIATVLYLGLVALVWAGVIQI